jgi:hypothetical protein
MNNKIENYYKNIDNPIINNYINNLNLKNLLELSTETNLYLFKKKKKSWILKDKRILLIIPRSTILFLNSSESFPIAIYFSCK